MAVTQLGTDWRVDDSAVKVADEQQRDSFLGAYGAHRRNRAFKKRNGMVNIIWILLRESPFGCHR